MSTTLRPRRGKKANAEAQLTAANPLKNGEIFFEVPDTGVGTGEGKIKMGDGETAYAELSYFTGDSGDYDAIIGNTDISGIADGTLTGAVSELNTTIDGKMEVSEAFKSSSGNKIIPTIILEITNDMITSTYMSSTPSFTVRDYTLPNFCDIIIKLAKDFNKTTSQFQYWSYTSVKINGYTYPIYQSVNRSDYLYQPKTQNTTVIYNPKISSTYKDFCRYRKLGSRLFEVDQYFKDTNIPYSEFSLNWGVSTSYSSKFVFKNGTKRIIGPGETQKYQMVGGDIYTIDGNGKLELYIASNGRNDTSTSTYTASMQNSFMIIILTKTIASSSSSNYYPSGARQAAYFVSHGGFSTLLNRQTGLSKAPIRINLGVTDPAPVNKIEQIAGSGTELPDIYGYIRITNNANTVAFINIIQIM